MTADQLAEIAAQLVARVRDDDPEANARWLGAVLPSSEDWFRLAFVLAAAVPDDVQWSHLTAWARMREVGDGRPDTPEKIETRRVELGEALRGADPRARTRSAA